MKTKFLFLIQVLLAQFIFNTSNAQVPADLEQKLQDTLIHMKNLYNFKGLSASVGYKNSGIWKSAVGESAAGVNLTTDDLIGIGSNTKTFVSAMMLKLVEDGLIHLNDSIGTWVSGYANINGQVSIRQILNHTSGLANYTDNTDFWDSVNVDLNRLWTKQEILSKFVTTPLFPVGTSWSYSNTNYIIAGLIEEQVLSKPIYQILRDSILNPLALNHTFFPPYETPSFPYAEVYTDIGAGYAFWNFPFNLNTAANSAGALVSNAEDNTKFWQALFNGQIIKKSTLSDSMMNWVPLTSSVSYGLGIFKEKYFGNNVFSHGGTWIGQINSNLADTIRNVYITVLSNQDSLDNAYTEDVVAALYKVVLNYVPTGIADIHSNNSPILFYPNPSNDKVIIDNSLLNFQTVSLFDMNGSVVYEKKITDLQKQIQLNLSMYKSGVYIIKCSHDKEVYTARLVIQH